MEPYIRLENVTKAFDGQVVLNSINLSVYPGETVVVLGMSGMGKSVTLQHIVGFIKPDSGRVWVAGQDITDFSEQELTSVRKLVAYIFQSNALFDSLSTFDNVAFPLMTGGAVDYEAIDKRVREILRMVNLEEEADLLPADLSTGMKKRVAIARALAADPQCLLYDEPTTGVDPLIAKQVGALIKSLDDQLHLTSVVVTHDLKLARYVADRIAFLHQGDIIFEGTFEAMRLCQHPIVSNFLNPTDSTIFQTI
jgi:phospholipid/cholesterol/gamma-HCH transport system ATP-binding protein